VSSIKAYAATSNVSIRIGNGTINAAKIHIMLDLQFNAFRQTIVTVFTTPICLTVEQMRNQADLNQLVIAEKILFARPVSNIIILL